MTGFELLRNPKIKAAIEAKLTNICTDLEITPRTVLQGLAKLAFFDPRKFYNDDGSLKKVTHLRIFIVVAPNLFN